MHEISAEEIKLTLARLAERGELRLAERLVVHYPRSPITTPAGMARTLLDAERDEN